MNKEQFEYKLRTTKPMTKGDVYYYIDKILDNTPPISKTLMERVLIFTIEECSELQKAITKYMRGISTDKIELVEEMADVILDIRMIMRLFNISEDEINRATSVKLNRSSERIDENGELL